MTTLQRSAVSFRRQGSSGRTWTDHQIIIDPQSDKITNDVEEEDFIRIRKSSSSTSSSSSSSSPSSYFYKLGPRQDISSSSSSSTRTKPPGCGLSSFFRHCIIGSLVHA
ncbi:unnamed protein product [Cochlearia groenlandica]